MSLSAIGADHTIEHEIKCMKVRGQIKGVTNNQAALDQYFLIAPEVNKILNNFYLTLSIYMTKVVLPGSNITKKKWIKRKRCKSLKLRKVNE